MELFELMRAKNNILHSLLTFRVVLVFPAALLVSGAQNEPATSAVRAEAIPLDQLSAVAARQYSGDGLAKIPTAQGAHLRCVFQKLEGEATSEGLWLTSTVTGAVTDRFPVRASSIGRVAACDSVSVGGPHFISGSQRPNSLSATGHITVDDQKARFTRAGLVEEY